MESNLSCMPLLGAQEAAVGMRLWSAEVFSSSADVQQVVTLSCRVTVEGFDLMWRFHGRGDVSGMFWL